MRPGGTDTGMTPLLTAAEPVQLKADMQPLQDIPSQEPVPEMQEVQPEG